MLTVVATGPKPGNEFALMADKLGVDPGTRVDPCSGLLYATGHRRCRNCVAGAKCREALRQKTVTPRMIASFCPSSDILFDLLHRGVARCA